MPKVLVIGDVIDDILVSPKGDIRIDTDTPASIVASPGGSGANFACWLASLGLEVNFVGRVGKADLERQEEILRQYGVNPFLQADENLQTGRIVILVEGESRSFLTDRGANIALDLDAIPEELFGEALYISGYSVLDKDPAQVQKLIARAREHGLVMCDPGSAGYIADHSAHAFLEAISGADILVPSLEEGRVLTSEDRPDVIAGQLANRFSLVALTMGARGVQVAFGNESIKVEAFEADLVDATGAGDAFAAKFLAELLKLSNPKDAAREANRFAAKVVTKMGGRPQ